MTMYPKVPDAPGVPPLARDASNTQTGVPSPVGVIGSESGGFDQLTQDGPGVSSATDAPKWGLFKDNTPVISPDSFLGLEATKEYRVSDYPIEDGGFASYNKVEMPFVGKITYAKGGSEADRTQFLTEIQDAVRALDLYTLVTPEISYPQVNATHYDYRRISRNGVTMLTVEVWIEEIRNNVTASFSNTQQPEGADPKNNGGVQPQTPTAAQSAAVKPVT